MLRIEHCIYFVEIAKAGSISKAAEALHMSQPHLSQCLRQLEAIVGTALVERHARGLTLTSTGHQCLEHCQALVDEAAILQNWQRESQNRSVLKVATFNAYAPINSFYEVTSEDALLATAESSLESGQSQLFEVYNRDVVEMVIQQQANLGVVYVEDILMPHFIKMLKRKGLDWLLITQGNVDVVMSSSHPLAASSGLTSEDIKPYTMVFESYKNARHPLGHIALLEPSEQSWYLQQFNQFLSRFTIQEIGLSNMRSLLYYLSKNTTSLTLGQRRYNRDNPQLKSGELVYVPLLDAPFKLATGVIFPQRLRFTELEQRFVEVLRHQVIDL